MTIHRRDIVSLVIASLLALGATFTLLITADCAWRLMHYEQFPFAVVAGGFAGAFVMGTGLFVLGSVVDRIEDLLDQVLPN